MVVLTVMGIFLFSFSFAQNPWDSGVEIKKVSIDGTVHQWQLVNHTEVTESYVMELVRMNNGELTNAEKENLEISYKPGFCKALSYDPTTSIITIDTEGSGEGDMDMGPFLQEYLAARQYQAYEEAEGEKFRQEKEANDPQSSGSN